MSAFSCTTSWSFYFISDFPRFTDRISNFPQNVKNVIQQITAPFPMVYSHSGYKAWDIAYPVCITGYKLPLLLISELNTSLFQSVSTELLTPGPLKLDVN